MVRQSMTGFARMDGQLDGAMWQWEVRSVNGRSLDLRFRLPEGMADLEKVLRLSAVGSFGRGNLNLSLRLETAEAKGMNTLDVENLLNTLNNLKIIETTAMDAGIAVQPMNAVDILALRGVTEAGGGGAPSAALLAHLKSEVKPLFAALKQARLEEGAAISKVLLIQIETIHTLTRQAKECAEVRAALRGDQLRQKVAALLEITELADEPRLQQELALLAVKADVTEEIDRLMAHVDAAQTLMNDAKPVGRKLDFLMQEFNREANTLCSKSGSVELTSIGLELKTVIDQMREQVQNLE